jgi:hypothetical protein
MFDPQFETPKSGRLSINTPIFANILRPTNGEVIHNRGIPLAAAHNNKSVSKSNSGRRIQRVKAAFLLLANFRQIST